MARLSLCMIVKDEAEMLPECLASVQGVVDEIVIVDTGSTDDTVAIAHAAGAKVVHEPWQNDFARARNAALAHATGDYVLQLDADERLAMLSKPMVRAVVEKAASRWRCSRYTMRGDATPAIATSSVALSAKVTRSACPDCFSGRKRPATPA